MVTWNSIQQIEFTQENLKIIYVESTTTKLKLITTKTTLQTVQLFETNPINMVVGRLPKVTFQLGDRSIFAAS